MDTSEDVGELIAQVRRHLSETVAATQHFQLTTTALLWELGGLLVLTVDRLDEATSLMASGLNGEARAMLVATSEALRQVRLVQDVQRLRS